MRACVFPCIILVCVCVCVWVCARARVCVCVCNAFVNKCLERLRACQPKFFNETWEISMSFSIQGVWDITFEASLCLLSFFLFILHSPSLANAVSHGLRRGACVERFFYRVEDSTTDLHWNFRIKLSKSSLAFEERNFQKTNREKTKCEHIAGTKLLTKGLPVVTLWSSSNR